MSAIQRLFRDYKAATDRGVPLGAHRDDVAEARLKASRITAPVSRRAFVAGTGAVAGAAALGISGRASAKSDPSIAIVGGGIAGLTTALRLADRNIKSTVYEGYGRVGGRMFSNTTSWANNQVSEWCGELIDTGHVTVQKLAKRFGLPLDDLIDAQPAGSQDTYKFFGHYYPKAQADIDFAPVFAAVTADQDAAPYPTSYDNFTADGQTLDMMSIWDWIESRVPGGHSSPIGQLLDTAYNIEFGADTNDQSALNIIYLLAFQPTTTQLDVFGESDERFHIRGGNERLPKAIAECLGPSVKLNHKLLRIKQTPGGRYKLTFDRNGSSVDVTADYVVLALPFAVLRNLDYSGAGFDALKDLAIQELGRGDNGKTQLQFNKRFWNKPGAWPGNSNGNSYTDEGYQAGWEVTRGQPGATGILNFYSGGTVADSFGANTAFGTVSNATVKADVALTLKRAEKVFPGATQNWNGRGTQSLPDRSAQFGASYSYWRVGQLTLFGGYEGVTQGNVWFAGEHTSPDFQGFMEGGASEGKRAAREIAKAIHGHDDADIL
jgi:monoamine oxidase